MQNRKQKVLWSLMICVVVLSLVCAKQSSYANNSNVTNADITTASYFRYPVNANGQTYGIEDEHGTPDLIEAVGENEIYGYVKRTDLLDEGDFIGTLEDARDYDKKRLNKEEQNEYKVIPLYKNDGITIIGKFRIYY